MTDVSHFPPFAYLHPSPATPSPGLYHTIVYVHGLCIYVLYLIPLPSFIQFPHLLSSDICHVSMPLVLFCLLVLFVH